MRSGAARRSSAARSLTLLRSASHGRVLDARLTPGGEAACGAGGRRAGHLTPARRAARVGPHPWNDTRAWRTRDATRSAGWCWRRGTPSSTRSPTVDLDRPSRLPGWRAHEIAVHLGCWDDHTALADLIASARSGGAGTPPEVDAVNARVTAAHRNASRDEVLAALRRNRDATARYLDEEPVELDTAPTVSVVGRLPLLSVVLGQAYELAVHGLDLVSCGAEPPPAVGAAVGAGRAGRRDGRAGGVLRHHRRGHPGDAGRRLGLRRGRRRLDGAPGARRRGRPVRRSRRRRRCCSRRRRAGSTRCRPRRRAG